MKRPAYASDKVLKEFIKTALEEDIQNGDHSTLSTIQKIWNKEHNFWLKKTAYLPGGIGGNYFQDIR
jgi:nicotinate-nucleotide pyrophosphorylase (carboxylating)